MNHLYKLTFKCGTIFRNRYGRALSWKKRALLRTILVAMYTSSTNRFIDEYIEDDRVFLRDNVDFAITGIRNVVQISGQNLV